jgi:hypothetical protein
MRIRNLAKDLQISDFYLIHKINKCLLFRLEDDCPVYTIHLVCRVPDRKHAPSAVTEGGGAARTGSVGETTGRVGALRGPVETPGQEVQDWMRYMQDLTNSSSQLSEENLQQVTFLTKFFLRIANFG